MCSVRSILNARRSRAPVTLTGEAAEMLRRYVRLVALSDDIFDETGCGSEKIDNLACNAGLDLARKLRHEWED